MKNPKIHSLALILSILSYTRCDRSQLSPEELKRLEDFENCYVNTRVFFKNRLGYIRNCISKELPPIKQNFCKRVVDCVEENLVLYEEPLSKTGVERLSAEDRMWDVDERTEKESEEEYAEMVRNTFVFLFQADCKNHAKGQHLESISYFTYWFFSQVEMQKCWRLQSNPTFSDNYFDEWEDQMKKYRRTSNEMEYITEFFVYYDIKAKPWPPPPNIHPILYSKIVYSEKDRSEPLGIAKFSFIYDRERAPNPKNEQAMRKQPRLGFFVVGRYFECYDIEAKKDECQYWDRQVHKPFSTARSRTEAERVLYQNLAKAIPKKSQEEKLMTLDEIKTEQELEKEEEIKRKQQNSKAGKCASKGDL